ncbi:hypothetical protein GWI33_014420 [Rhynchophorus ferrugineus]|uniref:Uncharacterized protein n=1 Tax=Rhynchophorus ferrugineus TaxID=354439 RepID=A0A834I4J5_RHYFE|nr:hypothetical protein GWI33_014420 [Rhynchophorus ferrugineus]
MNILKNLRYQPIIIYVFFQVTEEEQQRSIVVSLTDQNAIKLRDSGKNQSGGSSFALEGFNSAVALDEIELCEVKVTVVDDLRSELDAVDARDRDKTRTTDGKASISIDQSVNGDNGSERDSGYCEKWFIELDNVDVFVRDKLRNYRDKEIASNKTERMTLTNSPGSDPERETMEIRGELEHDDHHKPKDAIVETKIRSDGVGGPVDEIDFIEMQTIDADVFLKAKCVCTDRVQTTATDFCKDCFREQMVSTTGTETLDDGGGAVERSDKGLRNTSEACANAGFNEAGEARQWQCVESDSGVYTREPSTDDSCKNSPEESCEAVTSLDRLDPGGASPNSSPTVPSRRPSHGTPCALSCTSIEERCAPASACSRESATDVAASDALESRVSQDHPPAATFLTQTSPENRADVSRRVPPQEPLRGSAADGQLSREHLSWGFRNGRLVFVESKSDLGGSRLRSEQVVGTDDVNSRSEDESVSNRTNRLTDKDILYSKDINKRLDENKSRLKYLEDKLKKAGITHDPTSSSHCRNCVERTICDCAQNTNPNQTVTVQNHHYNPARHQQQNQTDENNCGNLTIYADFQDNKDETKSGLDSNQNIVNNFAFDCDEFIPEGLGDICQFDVNNFGGFVEVPPPGYYDEFLEDSSTEESCSQCDEEDHFIVIRRMRGDGANMVNEAERSKHNPDRDNLKSLLKKPGRAKEKKSNRVVFNENKNEFFDADYIILIREECDYDEDDDDGVCTCNQHEMVRLTCCEPNCGCQGYDGFEPTPQSPKFAPPIEFVDAVTLSPPEGYKDMEMMGRGSQRGAVCRECSATHDDEIDDEGKRWIVVLWRRVY